MSDNPSPVSGPDPGACFALPGHRVVALDGPDALKFAQAQFMNDVAALAIGQWQWNGWLTPKGRLIALFALLRLDAEVLWLVLPDADPAELTAKLQRFVFRSKVTLSVRDDLHACGMFSPPAHASGARFSGAPDGSVELDVGGEGGARTLRLSPAEAQQDAAVAGRWLAFDLRHGLPRLPASQAEQWTPQMLSLERLHAFSVKKGCYPGQEIVARTHFLGQVKRGLTLLESGITAPSGGEVHAGDRAIGTVVSAGDHLALAVLPPEPSGAMTLCVDGHAMRQLPLLGGLQR